MNLLYQKAIELKYAGESYRDISKALGGKLTTKTLEAYFSLDGILWLPYKMYEAKQNNWRDEHHKNEHKKTSAFTAEIRRTLLKKALKKGDYRLALDIVKDIDDRAGNVVVRKSEVKEENKTRPLETLDDYVQECIRLGIDPNTGFPPGASPEEKN